MQKLVIHSDKEIKLTYDNLITVDDSPRSDEAHQESVRRRLLYIAAQLN